VWQISLWSRGMRLKLRLLYRQTVILCSKLSLFALRLELFSLRLNLFGL